MPYRCPYCRTLMPDLAHATCTRCGRTMRLPPSARPLADRRERKRAKARTARDADRERRAFGRFAAMPRRSPFQLIVIVAVLVLIGAVVLSGAYRPRRAPVLVPGDIAQAELNALRGALDVFRADLGRYPTPAEGLTVLIANPDNTDWQGPYITLLRADPWGRPYRYALDGDNPAVVSDGPDQQPGTADDLMPLGWDPLPPPGVTRHMSAP